jgi:hypothetical protein
MSERIVAYSVTADAEAEAEVVKRLQEKGVEIIERRPHMLLLSGDPQTIGQALGGARGWRAGGETKVPPPSTRGRVLKRP